MPQQGYFSIPQLAATRVCADCRTDISNRHGNARLCRDCRSERERTAARLRKRELQKSEAYRENRKVYRRGESERYAERCKQYSRGWQQRNKVHVLEYNRARRAKMYEQMGSVTPGIKGILTARQNRQCAFCRAKLGVGRAVHLDHVMPLALGGMHDDANLQVLCQSCNLHKQAKDPIKFARENGRLL